jgi:hypothetical protein
LNEQPARVGQHQPGALCSDDPAGRAGLGKEHAMRRGVVLHISCPGAKSYSPERRGGLRRPASLAQRVRVL